MKKYIISAFALFTLFTTTGCQDWLDVNHSPNVLEEVPDAKVLLPAAEMNLANTIMGWEMGFSGGFWSEYWTQKYTASQFKSICQYADASFSTAYQNLTAGVLTDLEKIKTVSLDKGNTGNYFIAEALAIYTWQIMTDVWGNIPYSEAIKGDQGIFMPKFDNGEDIYADLQTRIDALLTTDLSGATVDKEYDFVFGGNLSMWKLFANSLKLKLMMRQSETSGYNNSAVISFIESNELLTVESAQIGGDCWQDALEGKRHPMREFEAGGAGYFNTNVIGCKNFVEYLDVNNDPRLSKLFKIVDPAVGYRGAFFGDYDSKEKSDGSNADNNVKYCAPYFEGDTDLPLISNWEVNFFIAEAYARGGQLDNARNYYEAGVKASLAQHGIDDASILDGYAAWTAATPEQGVKQIMMQKWVANAHYQHIESFLEHNRTKYPATYEIDIKAGRVAAFSDTKILGNFTIAVMGRAKLNGKLPSSPIYPSSVLSRNENAPGQKVNMGEKVWWDQKNDVIIK